MADSTDGTVPKRGRGRPRKDRVEKPTAKTQDKRPRGRPRKVPAATTSPVEAVKSSEKRPRGRPKKSAPESGKGAISKARGKTSTTGRAKEAESQQSEEAADPTAGTSGDIESRAATPAPVDPFGDAVVGTYRVDFPAVSKEWPESADKMTISINRNSADRPEYIGWFNFGVLEGVMLLTPDLARLKGYYERQCKGGIKPSLIKFMTVADVLQKEDVPEEVKQRAQEEDQRLGASCLYFMWRGRETGEAQEFTEEIAETKGCLQFGDVTGAKFTGLGDFAFVGDDCEFTGVKVKDTIDIEPEPWNTFQI